MAVTARNKVYTHLWFAKGADEAAKFYASIFPDSKVDRVISLPTGSTETQVVDFTVLGQRFQAITAGEHHPFNDAVSIVIECENQAEIDRYYDALAKDGGKAQPCGWVIDRYGVRWQIVPAALNKMWNEVDPKGAKRIVDAQMTMKKLDIAALEKASRG